MSIRHSSHFFDVDVVLSQRPPYCPIVVHKGFRVIYKRLNLRFLRIRNSALFLEDKTKLRGPKLKLLLFRLELQIREFQRLICRRDTGAIHLNLALRVSHVERDLLSHLCPPGGQRVLLRQSPGVVRLSGSVAERNRQIETNSITGVAVAEQLPKRIGQPTMDNADDVATQTRPECLNAANAALCVTDPNRQIRQQLILRVLNINVAVLKLQR